MVKTHPESRFVLYSLTQIRESVAVIPQIEDTDTKFEGGAKCYLCEIVPQTCYNRRNSVDALADEIIRVNSENRRLQQKVNRLTKKMEALSK